jgi:AcrR family transcriptional regulator
VSTPGRPAPPERPLRSDAQRNRELLLATARQLFAERGVDVPLEEIAHRAGVSIGTLYNRFPARADLIDAVFTDRLQKIVALTEAALAAPDPWTGFAACLTGICELQAGDRGYNEVAARGLATASPVNERLRRTGRDALAEVLGRAQRSGAVRPDVTVDDLSFVIWGIAATVAAIGERAPDAWRRHLGLLLDGFRAEGAHRLPGPPLPNVHDRPH